MDTGFTPTPPELSRQSFEKLAQFITCELGIKMPESKLTMVQSRLLRRVRELGMNSVEQYSEYFFSCAAKERDHLINAITTNKTDFFREPEHFDYLVRTVLPAVNRATGGLRQVKVWSAGCATGEEPYTLAMVLSEYARRQRGFDFAILATDVSPKVLAQAHKGIYREELIHPVPVELRRKYLLRSKDNHSGLVRVVPRLRERISFSRLNFMDTSYGVKDLFDVVFFRNVLIYFEKDTQEVVVNKLCRHLATDGYLFLGHSESLAGHDVPLRTVGNSIFRKSSGDGRRGAL